MRKSWAFLNGRMIPADELTIPAYDAGFVLGATVSEQLRTFGGRLFKLTEHLSRLRRGLEIAAIDPGCTVEEFAAWAEELVAANHKLLDPADDLGLSLFVTPGPYGTFAPPNVPRRATIGMSTYPLPFRNWAQKYDGGERLATSKVRQVPAESWPREMKCRSRMHYYLADQEVSRRIPGTRALLLDERGYVNETSTANVVGLTKFGTLWTPLREGILPGISQATLHELAYQVLAMREFSSGQSQPAKLADEFGELMLTSTPFCVLPVVALDDLPIGDGKPGPTYRKLLAAWSEEVGIDIAAQARRFAARV